MTVCIATGAILIGGQAWARSALSGGGIGIVAGLYQAFRIFRADMSRQPERFLSSVYVSEALKIVLTVALFIAAIRVLRVELIPVIVAYAATYVVYWVALGTGYPWMDSPAGGRGETDQEDD